MSRGARRALRQAGESAPTTWHDGGMTDVREPDQLDEPDPFAAFDKSVGVGQIRDPYPLYHELRSECPVQAGPQWERFGVETPMEAALADERTPYALLSFNAVHQALKYGETFSSSGYGDSIGLVMGHSI